MKRTWSPRAAGGAGMAALAALGAAATVVAVSQARAEARSHSRQEVEAVAEGFSVRLQSSLSSMRGVDGIASDGTVTDDEFRSYATDVIAGSDFAALAYSDVVADGDRSAWEAESGHPMVDLRDGEFVAAGGRPIHVVIRHVHPVNDLTRDLFGFDLEGEPSRAAGIDAAREQGEAVVGPIALAQTGAPGVFLIRAVNGPSGDVIGFVSAGISVDALLGGPEGLREVSGVRLWIDDEPLLTSDDPTDDSHTVRFRVADHAFTLQADDADRPDWLLSIIVASGTALLFVGLWATLRRASRERQREERTAERNRRLADLRDALASATDAEQVVRTLLRTGGNALGADWTGVNLRDPLDREIVRVSLHDIGDSVDLDPDGIADLDDFLPLAPCMRDGAVITVTSRSRPSGGAKLTEARDGRGRPVTTVCAPLSLGADQSAGAVGFGWRDDLTDDEVEDVTAAAELAAQMVGRALERALVREVVQTRVEQLSEFARLLSTTRATSEIQALVDRRLPRLLEVQAASIGAPLDARLGTVRTYPAPAPQGADLHLLLRPGTEWTPTLQALTEAVIELIEGAWIRASEQEEEHLVLQRFQASLLLPAPEIAGFDIAVSYRSALATVGIGGDWYSVIDRPDVVHLLVGDVAGHGPGAVAIMAECKTILRHLLSGGAPIEDALAQADAALRRRGAYASVVAVAVDKHADTLTYLNAGHPGPILAAGSGAVVLGDVHRPWLGVDGSSRPPTSVPFAPGSRLLLYTDGLIEDRVRPLDECVAALVADVGTAPDAPQALVDRLITDRARDRGPTAVDDDIALIAIAKR